MTTENKTSALSKDAELTHDEKNWAMLCHISALVGFLIPFGNIIGPLIVWQMKKNESSFIDDQGKEALNFHLSVTIYLIVSAFLILIAIGLLFIVVIGLVSLILTVIAAINASNGVKYRYPLTLRLIE